MYRDNKGLINAHRVCLMGVSIHYRNEASRKGYARQQNNLLFFKDSKRCIGCPETSTFLDDSRYDRFSHVSRTFPWLARSCSRVSSAPRGFFVGMRISTSGSVKDRKPRSCHNPLPAGSG